MKNFRMKNGILKRLPRTFAACVLLFLSFNNAFAGQDLFLSESSVISSMVFAETSANTLMTESNTAVKPEFKQRWFTANKFHQYLGLGSLALATLTAIAPKPSEDDPEEGIHPDLARSAAYLGGAAVISGLAFHYKDLTWKSMFRNPDNLHALLGTLGTLGYFAAISDAPNSAHATYGVAGAVSMLASIKITW